MSETRRMDNGNASMDRHLHASEVKAGDDGASGWMNQVAQVYDH